MTLPTPPRPTDPIPNNPFYSVEEWSINGAIGPLVVGNGLDVSEIGVISATGVTAGVADIFAGNGIFVDQPNGEVTISNTGVLSVAGGDHITVSQNTGDIIISADPYPVNSVVGVSPIQVTPGGNAVISIVRSSTTAVGAVQLYNALDSNSQILALTAAQGKALQDQINALSIGSNLILAGVLDASTGLLASVTSEGAAVGFTVGDPIPFPSSANADYFVIVGTAGTYTPPLGNSVYASQGDWFLSDGAAWSYLNVGFDPTDASETTAGVVRLATQTETHTGTDATIAVTPDGLQSKVSDSVSLTDSNCIASSTAVRSAYDLAFEKVPCSAFVSKGSLLSASAPFTPSLLLPGADGEVLSVNSAAPEGLSWVTAGTVRQVSTGTGLTGGPITSTGTIALDVTGVTPGSYQFPSLTINAQGQITATDTALAPITCRDFDAKGDLLVGFADDSFGALSVGSDTQVLTADSACPEGMKWVTPCQGTVTNVTTGTGLTGGPITTTGQIALADTAVTPGSYTNVNLTVDQQGRITSATSGPAPGTSVLEVCAGGGLVSDPVAGITECGTICLPLQTSNGVYTNVCNVTVDQYGRVTALSQADQPIVETVFTDCGQIVTRNNTGDTTALARGADGLVLTANSSCALGLQWASPSSFRTNWCQSTEPVVRDCTASTGGLIFGIGGAPPEVDTSSPSSVTCNFACYRQVGPTRWQVFWQFSKVSAGGTIDSGADQYNFVLPSQVPNFDTSAPGQAVFTGCCTLTGNSPDYSGLLFPSLDVMQGSYALKDTTPAGTIAALPWDANKTRFVAQSSNNGSVGFVGPNWFSLAGTANMQWGFGIEYTSV